MQGCKVKSLGRDPGLRQKGCCDIGKRMRHCVCVQCNGVSGFGSGRMCKFSSDCFSLFSVKKEGHHLRMKRDSETKLVIPSLFITINLWWKGSS